MFNKWKLRRFFFPKTRINKFEDILFRKNPSGSNFPFGKIELTNKYELHVTDYSGYYGIVIVNKVDGRTRSVGLCSKDEVSAIMERIQKTNQL